MKKNAFYLTYLKINVSYEAVKEFFKGFNTKIKISEP